MDNEMTDSSNPYTAEYFMSLCNEDNKADMTYIEIAEVRLCVGYYKHEITKLRVTAAQPLRKDMKTKILRLEKEYVALCAEIKRLNMCMRKFESDDTDIQALFDMRAAGTNVAKACLEIMHCYKLPAPPHSDNLNIEDPAPTAETKTTDAQQHGENHEHGESARF
jgi:hypothetical protein